MNIEKKKTQKEDTVNKKKQTKQIQKKNTFAKSTLIAGTLVVYQHDLFLPLMLKEDCTMVMVDQNYFFL